MAASAGLYCCIPPLLSVISSSSSWASPFLVSHHPRPHPLHSLSDSRARQRTDWQDSRVPDHATLCAFEYRPHEPLFDTHRLNTVLSILLVRKNEDRNALRRRLREDRLEDEPRFLQSPSVSRRRAIGIVCCRRVVLLHAARDVASSVHPAVTITDVRAIDNEDDGMAASIIALPEFSERVLTSDVPNFEVHVVEVNEGDILADGGDGLLWRDERSAVFGVVVSGRPRVGDVGRLGWRRGIERLDAVEERSLAGVVKAEQEDRVL